MEDGRREDYVAPLAGAWIEILADDVEFELFVRRSPRGSVD